MAPAAGRSKVACAEPSPQSTSTCHGLSLAPASLNEPRSTLVGAPSFADWSAGAITTGAMLATLTIRTACEAASEAPSESVTLMATLVVCGPSGNRHWKEPPEAD